MVMKITFAGVSIKLSWINDAIKKNVWMKTILQKLIHQSLVSAIYSWKLQITRKSRKSMTSMEFGLLQWRHNEFPFSLPQSPHPHLTQLANLMLFFPYSHFVYFSYVSFPSFAWRRTSIYGIFCSNLSILQMQEKSMSGGKCLKEPIHTLGKFTFKPFLSQRDPAAQYFGEGKSNAHAFWQIHVHVEFRW